MRSIIELMNFYNENKQEIEEFFKQQKKENYKSLREAYQEAQNKSASKKVAAVMSSNEGIIFWVIDLLIVILAIWLIINNSNRMKPVAIAFAVMFLLLPLGPLFSIVIVFATRRTELVVSED